MGFPPLLNLSTRLSTAALPGQTTKMAQTLESMFQNVAYRPTVYRTGPRTIGNELENKKERERELDRPPAGRSKRFSNFFSLSIRY